MLIVKIVFLKREIYFFAEYLRDDFMTFYGLNFIS